MKVGRIGGRWIALTGMLLLSGCAHLSSSPAGPSFGQVPTRASSTISSLPLIPPKSAGVSSLLDYGGQVAVLPNHAQQAACEQAKARLTRHPSDHARMTLALLAAVDPECLPSGQIDSMVEPMANNPDSPFRGLARVVANLAGQRKTSSQALALARQEVAGLNQKLRALTRIETQLNQVKDRELQNLH